MNHKQGLCVRCEHRARFHETGSRPRHECGVYEVSTHSCYMYKPVLPVVTEKAHKKDKRPRLAGAMISARERFVRVAEGKLKCKTLRNGEVILYWMGLK